MNLTFEQEQSFFKNILPKLCYFTINLNKRLK